MLAFTVLGGAAVAAIATSCGSDQGSCEIYCISAPRDAGAGSAGSAGSDAGTVCPVCADSHGTCPAGCEPIG